MIFQSIYLSYNRKNGKKQILHKLQTYINYINLLSLLLLTFVSVYDFYLQRIPLYLFFTSYLVEFCIEKKWQNIKVNRIRWYYIILAFFFLLAIIYHPFEHSDKYFIPLLDRRFSLLGFSIIGFFGVNNKYKLKYFLDTFILSSLIAVFYILFLKIGLMNFIISPLKIDLFNLSRDQVSTHMCFNIYLNTSLVCLWFVISNYWGKKFCGQNAFYLISLSIILSTLFITEGRTGFLTAISLITCFAHYFIWTKSKMATIVTTIFIPLILLASIANKDRFSKKELDSEPRLFLWKAAINTIKAKPIFGYGVSNGQEHFDIERLKLETPGFSKAWYTYVKIIPSHNQFLQSSIEFGIIGLSLTIFIYIFPVIYARRKFKFFAIFLLLPIVYQSMFDIVLTGLSFSSLFCTILLMILNIGNDEGGEFVVENR